jgi:hypothetical protein
MKPGFSLSPATQFKKGVRPAFYKGIKYHIARAGGKPYRLIHKPEHPRADYKGYVREHRLVMEQHLGRYLLPSEIVHHKDGDTLNNTRDNLEVMEKVEHDRLNTPLNIHKRWQREGGVALSP